MTVTHGTNQLLTDLNPETVRQRVVEILNGYAKPGTVPPLWDGEAAGRIAKILAGYSLTPGRHSGHSWSLTAETDT